MLDGRRKRNDKLGKVVGGFAEFFGLLDIPEYLGRFVISEDEKLILDVGCFMVT
ncbi:MAG: hypothetical protein IKY67_04800 [Paludibacteraceae bacterium]|nr:hypothetical protein [Paludibacteraceae bacterium]